MCITITHNTKVPHLDRWENCVRGWGMWLSWLCCIHKKEVVEEGTIGGSPGRKALLNDYQRTQTRDFCDEWRKWSTKVAFVAFALYKREKGKWWTLNHPKYHLPEADSKTFRSESSGVVLWSRLFMNGESYQPKSRMLLLEATPETDALQWRRF